MILGIFRRINEKINRKIQRDFLNDPEKAPKRYAMYLASILLLSMIVTYSVLFEKEKGKQG